MTSAVVTGASGLLGGAVLRELAAHGHGVRGWSHTVAEAPDGVHFERVELRDPQALAGALHAARPELLVHCAALTDVDACEADAGAAHALNAEVPRQLAAAAAAAGTRFVHISTDAVYGGERLGAHAEDEPPEPVNVYARTKLAGEEAVLETYPDALVLRTTMHGWTAQGKLSFSESILRALLRGAPLTLFSDVRFSVLNVTQLATCIRQLAAGAAAGVVNAGAADAVAKARFGRLVARAFGLADDAITEIRLADRALPAARPRNTALAVERLTELLGAPPPTVQDGVRRLREEASSVAPRLKGRPPGSLELLVSS